MIPLATTTVTVTRIVPADSDAYDTGAYDQEPDYDSGGDPYDPYDPSPPAATTIASKVRATIGEPSANENLVGGNRVEYTASFCTDPAGIEPGDTLIDETTGDRWYVLWARQVPTFGVAHVRGDVRMVEGDA